MKKVLFLLTILVASMVFFGCKKEEPIKPEPATTTVVFTNGLNKDNLYNIGAGSNDGNCNTSFTNFTESFSANQTKTYTFKCEDGFVRVMNESLNGIAYKDFPYTAGETVTITITSQTLWKNSW